MTEDTTTPAHSEPVAGPVQRPVRPLVRPLVDALRALPDTRPEPEPFEVWRDACGLALATADELDRLRRALHEIAAQCQALAREAHTWSKAAETYATQLERHKPLMQAVEWILDDGHMNQEHLARLRAAWEAV